MKISLTATLPALFMLAVASQEVGAAQSPRVVVTIPPIHAIVAGVMAGVGEPTLLVRGGASPHSYSLLPSQARALNEARLVVRVSEYLESFLDRAIESLTGKADVITLSQVEGMTLHDTREGSLRKQHDPHLWLDPQNAKRIATAVSMKLQKVYPEHAKTFTANTKKLIGKLDILDRDVLAATKPLRTRPYIVFHDATRYFEERYRLKPVRAITISPDRPIGTRRASEIRATIKSQGVTCVFAEPQFQPKLVQSLISGTGARAGVLDPIGAGLPAGPELYFKLMRNLATSLAVCLKNPS
ncbi:MAG: zinc ABC transporter substrate-binding protein [Gammaproteobacteria bacterium]